MAAVVDISNGMNAVGVSEAVGVVGWLDPSVGGTEVGVKVVVSGTRAGGTVGLAAWLSPCEGAQETVINTNMESRINFFIVIPPLERFGALGSSEICQETGVIVTFIP